MVRWTEFHNHDVYRRVELPEEIAVKAVAAKFTNGLLKIEVPFKDPMDDAVDVPIH